MSGPPRLVSLTLLLIVSSCSPASTRPKSNRAPKDAVCRRSATTNRFVGLAFGTKQTAEGTCCVGNRADAPGQLLGERGVFRSTAPSFLSFMYDVRPGGGKGELSCGEKKYREREGHPPSPSLVRRLVGALFANSAVAVSAARLSAIRPFADRSAARRRAATTESLRRAVRFR